MSDINARRWNDALLGAAVFAVAAGPVAVPDVAAGPVGVPADAALVAVPVKAEAY